MPSCKPGLTAHNDASWGDYPSTPLVACKPTIDAMSPAQVREHAEKKIEQLKNRITAAKEELKQTIERASEEIKEWEELL